MPFLQPMGTINATKYFFIFDPQIRSSSDSPPPKLLPGTHWGYEERLVAGATSTDADQTEG